jgi:hypothetical protein
VHEKNWISRISLVVEELGEHARSMTILDCILFEEHSFTPYSRSSDAFKIDVTLIVEYEGKCDVVLELLEYTHNERTLPLSYQLTIHLIYGTCEVRVSR